MGYSKEQAERALQGNPNLDGSLQRYFTAIIEGTLPQYYSDTLSHKRTDYSDELPSVDVRTLIDDPKRLTEYKCQGNYVLGLTLSLRQAVADGVISDQKLKQEIEAFVGSDLNFQVGDSQNHTRIRRINQVLDHALAHLARK